MNQEILNIVTETIQKHTLRTADGPLGNITGCACGWLADWDGEAPLHTAEEVIKAIEERHKIKPLKNIHDDIDDWHDNAADTVALHDYLGIPWNQYGAWVEGKLSKEELAKFGYYDAC